MQDSASYAILVTLNLPEPTDAAADSAVPFTADKGWMIMSKKVRTWIRSLQAKFLLYFVGMILLLLAAIIILNIISLRNLNRLTQESVTYTLDRMNADIENILTEAQDIAEYVARNSDIQSSLRGELPAQEGERYAQNLTSNDILFYVEEIAYHADALFVVGDNGALYHSYYSPREGDFRETDWYQQVMETGTALWLTPRAGSVIARNLDTVTFSVVVPVNDRASTRILGVVVADVWASELDTVNESEMVWGGESFILDDEHQVVYAGNGGTDVDAVNEGLAALDWTSVPSTATLTVGGKRYLAQFRSLEGSSWSIMGLISYDTMYAQSGAMARSIAVIIGFSLVVAVWFAVWGSRKISRPVRETLQCMERVENGDLSVRADERSRDEFGQINRGLNRMVSSLGELMKREKESQKKLTQAEIAALQAQINPHFLYNTLDSINWMARMNQTGQVSAMIDALVTFLRLGLSRGHEFITLENELTHVKSYFYIQKIRYERILNYEIQAPPGLSDCLVPKMILQPLAENALNHGLREKGEAGLIRIEVARDGEDLVLTVTDDGQGMRPERLREVAEMLETESGWHEDVYGGFNVQRRLRGYFGEGYGLSYESVYGEGTRATVRIPARREGNPTC